jgi:colicin import membrane protein
VLHTDIEIQLKVWKDLAISKQILMGAATEALGLDPECSSEELRTALTSSIKRSKEADANIERTREETATQIADMTAQVETMQKALTAAEAQVTESSTAREAAERRAEIGKTENAESIKKAKAEVAAKQNELKAISKALADTPDNVIKKLKALKKQKLDEARIRGLVETQLRTTRKDKTKIEQKLEVQKAEMEKVTPLLETLRDMRDLCVKANEKIKSLSEHESDLLEIPELDEELLDSLTETEEDESDDAEEKASVATG